MDSGLREVVRVGAEEGFAGHLRGLAAAGRGRHAWAYATGEVEQGLEVWVGKIAEHGRAAYVRAAAAAARWAYPTAIARAGEEAIAAGLAEEAPSPDGESEGMKILRVEGWLARPSEARRAAVRAAIDPTRRRAAWEHELGEDDETSWWWFFEVGQLCAMAVVHDEAVGDDDNASAYRWTAPRCAERAVIAAFKAARSVRGDVAEEVGALGRAIAAAFE